jgi:hypothetical protein
MSCYKIRNPTYARAMFLKDRALEICLRQGVLEPIYNAGVGRSYRGRGFSVWYAEPETSATDDYYHLDVRAERAKVLSVIWKDNGPPLIVTFRRGAWEQLFLS